MKLWNIIKKVGSGIIRNSVPGGGLILSAVNEFLPDDKKLSDKATGDDIADAVASLPPDQQSEIMRKKFDVDITDIQESNSTLRTMLESDAKNPHTTRPYIAKGSFLVVAFTVIVTISIWAYGVSTGDSELVKAVMGGWQFVLAVIGPLITLLWAYFGVLRREHENRLNAVSGNQKTSGLMGVLGSLINRGR